ncbi:MAG: hemolysin expression modulating protein, partial [Clostridiales bacterium 36_14]
MIRQNKKLLLLTSVITLLPVFIGLFLWNQLPDSVATHFGADNQPNGYSSKVFAVFGLPFILLMIHFICVVVTNIDPKEKNISKKVFQVVLWICPLVSLVVCNMIYVYNLGYQLNTGVIGGVLIGALYLILGNFIPKIKPNYSIGFRVPWALCDSENWYHTHRFGGKCMVIGGIVLIATSPFQNVWILLVLAIIPCILPVIYSY